MWARGMTVRRKSGSCCQRQFVRNWTCHLSLILYLISSTFAKSHVSQKIIFFSPESKCNNVTRIFIDDEQLSPIPVPYSLLHPVWDAFVNCNLRSRLDNLRATVAFIRKPGPGLKYPPATVKQLAIISVCTWDTDIRTQQFTYCVSLLKKNWSSMWFLFLFLFLPTEIIAGTWISRSWNLRVSYLPNRNTREFEQQETAYRTYWTYTYHFHGRSWLASHVHYDEGSNYTVQQPSS